MLQVVQRVNGRSSGPTCISCSGCRCVPFVTGWVDENHFAPVPVALYGVVLLMAGVSYYLLERVLIAHHGRDSALARALGKDLKGLFSVAIYVVAIALTLFNAWLSLALYVFVAIMWFIPDPRVERGLPKT